MHRAREVARDVLGLFGNEGDFLDYAGALSYASTYAETPQLLESAMESYEGPVSFESLERLPEREKYAVLLSLAYMHFRADMDLVADWFGERCFNGEYDAIIEAIEACSNDGDAAPAAEATVTLSLTVQIPVDVPEEALDRESGTVDIYAVNERLLDVPERVRAAFAETLNRVLAGDARQLERYELVEGVEIE